MRCAHELSADKATWRVIKRASIDAPQQGLFRARSENGWQLESLSYGDTVTFESVHFEAAAEMFYEDVLGSLK